MDYTLLHILKISFEVWLSGALFQIISYQAKQACKKLYSDCNCPTFTNTFHRQKKIQLLYNTATLYLRATSSSTGSMFAGSKVQDGLESALTHTISNLEQLR